MGPQFKIHARAMPEAQESATAFDCDFDLVDKEEEDLLRQSTVPRNIQRASGLRTRLLRQPQSTLKSPVKVESLCHPSKDETSQVMNEVNGDNYSPEPRLPSTFTFQSPQKSSCVKTDQSTETSPLFSPTSTSATRFGPACHSKDESTQNLEQYIETCFSSDGILMPRKAGVCPTSESDILMPISHSIGIQEAAGTQSVESFSRDALRTETKSHRQSMFESIFQELTDDESS